MNRQVIAAGVGVFAILALGDCAQAQIGPGAVVDLALVSAPTTLIGAVGGVRLGSSFSIGDFDGDGERDLAILASSTTAVDTLPPFIVILFGCSTLGGLIDLANYPGLKATITAAQGDAGTRASIVVGNFNGDMVDDLAFAIPNNTQATSYDGKVYVIFGSASLAGSTISLQNPPASVTRLFPPAGSGGWLGMAMATGDVNNDGSDELIVSAPFCSVGGRVYVMFGKPSFASTILLETAPGITKISETIANQACGVGLACGDVDWDGFDDILIGSPGDGLENARGIVTLVGGAPSMPSVLPLSGNTPAANRFYDEYQHGTLGWRVALADVNGDGRPDPVMAAPVADPLGCEDCGEVYVVYWNAGLPDSIPMSNTIVPMTRFLGSGHAQVYGENLSAGRLNGDLCMDLVIQREPDDFIPLDRRSVVVAYGGPALPDTVFLATDPTLARVRAEQPGDDLGVGLAVVDLDLNGLGELLIGAPLANALGRTMAGKVHMFSGDPVSDVESPPHRMVGLIAHPNPFGSSTRIQMFAPRDLPGTLSIFDVRGREILRVNSLSFVHGTYEFVWGGRDQAGTFVPSGVYFCRLAVGGARITSKLVLLR